MPIIPAAIAVDWRRVSNRKTTNIITALNAGISWRIATTVQSLTASAVPVKVSSPPLRTSTGG